MILNNVFAQWCLTDLLTFPQLFSAGLLLLFFFLSHGCYSHLLGICCSFQTSWSEEFFIPLNKYWGLQRAFVYIGYASSYFSYYKFTTLPIITRHLNHKHTFHWPWGWGYQFKANELWRILLWPHEKWKWKTQVTPWSCTEHCVDFVGLRVQNPFWELLLWIILYFLPFVTLACPIRQ